MNGYIQNCITFPCSGKRPLVHKWNTLTTRLPHDAESNYGILCGQKNKIMVVDCDLLKPEEDENKYLCGVKAWKMICSKFPALEKYDIPSVKTKSGGLHLYFNYHKDLSSGIQKLQGDILGHPGKTVKIDIISDNRYVIGPGSDGYKFIDHSRYWRPTDMPDYLLSFLNSLAKTDPAISHRVAPSEPTFTGRTENLITKDQLQHVVDGISDAFADNRDDWLKIIWAIADTAEKNGYLALDIADKFSQKSAKYGDIEDVAKIYNNNKGRITFGTLIFYSENKLMKSSVSTEDQVVESQTQTIFDENSSAKLDVVKDDLKIVLSNLKKINSVEVQKDNVFIIDFISDDDKNGKIIVKTNNLATFTEQMFAGYLLPATKVTEDPSVLHPDLGETSKFIFQDQNTIRVVDRSTEGGEHSVAIKYPLDTKNMYIQKYSHGKKVGNVIKNSKMNGIVSNILKLSCENMFQERYNVNVVCNQAVFNFAGGAEEKKIRSEYQIIQDLLEAHPGIVDNFKFCDNSKLGSFDGLFVTSSITGLWKREHNGRVEDMLLSRIKKYVPGLSEHELKFVETHSNIQSLRKMFVKKIIDNEFENKIDENLDLFATQQGVYDIKLAEFRRTLPTDYAMTNCGWKYSKADSEKYMNDVQNFFKKLFPIEEERNVVLTFIASLLHGHRLDKKFLIMTDKRNGNNGKSTVLNFLRVFFGDYLKGSTKFICKGAFDKDKDSHDGGLEPLKGKRVMLADELKKNMKLDEGLVKNLAGGKYVVEGRRFGKVDQFKFTWQAGIIMVFNEGDCPKFDSTDIAFMERMLVCPMRSKFMMCRSDDFSTHTYMMDPKIDSNFEKWRSSLLDFLVGYCKLDGLCDMKIPASMKEWKEEIISGNNELGEWIMEVVEITNNPEDVVSAAELKDKYKIVYGTRSISDRDFLSIARGLFNSKGVECKDRYRPRTSGEQKEKRNAFIGVKLVN